MIFTDAPEVNPTLTLDDLPGTFGDALGAAAKSALYNSPTWQLKRTWEDYQTPGGLKLDYETARTKAKEAGVDVQIDPKGVTEDELANLIERKRFQAKTRDALTRGPQGFTAGASYFLTGLGAAMLDPINLASAFIPIARGVGMSATVAQAGRLGEAGAAATTAGRVAARLRVGAVEGAGGQALLEPLTAYRASQEQEDYGITDTLMNVGFGMVLGAVAHTGLGAIGDRIAYAERGRKAGELLDAAKTAPERAAFAPDSAAAKLQSADLETNAAIFRSEVAAAADGRVMDNSVLVPTRANESLMPSPSTLAMPDVPTVEHMEKFSRVESVPLSKAVSFQAARTWESFDAGKHPGELITGYGDKPVALRLETGEYVIYDGNHRTDLAISKGDTSLDMHVIDVRNYDPQHAGRKPAQNKMSEDELLSELFGNKPPAIDPIKVQQAAIASHLPENDVHYDAIAKAEVDKEIAAKVEKEDPAEFVAQVTQEAQAELTALSKQLGIDPEKNAAMRSADEVTATASRYSKAIEAYVSCQART